MKLAGLLRRMARAMVGMPDYDAYRAHMDSHHPDRPVMDRTQFFRDRQEARYGAKGGGHCC
ncbi:YbdD/YjiX family protein [Sphingomonas solaris]|uniref:Putative selenoprotein n=1 Tax=Alterirhizorhabdus solaris TaxID=2529389 RepID=A0A558RA42_9SPHN|nr:CstA-like transporter-associated (seleno)protein [Sphingomonas solaris]TVV76244.1 putative selenoprotein [Sphingomonas solaris]